MDDSNGRWTRLKFDGRSRFGSHQHYFHFTWGYLLPALDRILSAFPDDPSRRFELDSCGPTMDPRILDLARLIDRPIRIARSASESDRVEAQEWVARWDVWFLEQTEFRIRWFERLHRHGVRHPVLAGIDRVRDFILSRALGDSSRIAATARSTPRATPTPGAVEWLLLKRSEEPSFYRVGGPSEKPTYGVTRRSIANLEELADGLVRRGLPVRIYEPGRDDLVHQVRAYHGAAGVIGIRGAELANILWMRPGTGVVMLVTPVKNENNVARHIARARRLHGRPIHVASDHPVVSPEEVLREIESLPRIDARRRAV